MSIRTRIELADGALLWVCEHAIERYRERVVPDLDAHQALDHLRRLAGLCGHRCEKPGWCHRPEHSRPTRWASLGPDLVLVCDGRRLVTVVQRKPPDRMAVALRDGLAAGVTRAAA